MDAVTQKKNILQEWGCPKYVLAPMVEASELAWRMLARRNGVQLTYTPMIHSVNFIKDKVYRQSCLQFDPTDRPLIIQFCSNCPDTFAEAAKLAQAYCDAVELNLGCPQGIARRGHYGAFLQDEWDLISSIVKKAVACLTIPVTCKIRVFKDVNKTVGYAKMLEAAGASILTVHGRTRDMKGQSAGLADWHQIKCVKQAVQVPVIANGNIEYLGDVHRCLSETGVDAVMSAESHLHNPALFTGDERCVIDMCLEYLSLTKEYPCHMSIVRGHLFKLCHNTLHEHPEFRNPLGKAHTVDEFHSAIIQLSELCKKCTENSDKSLPLPHWICQPYRRPTNSMNTTTACEQTPDEKENTGKRYLTTERYLRRQAKRANKAIQRSKSCKTSQISCSNCETNRKSENCPLDCCRTCCWSVDPNRLRDCTAHMCMKCKK